MLWKAIQKVFSDKDELSEFCLQTALIVQVLTGKEICPHSQMFHVCHQNINTLAVFSSLIYIYSPTFLFFSSFFPFIYTL